MKNAKKYWLLTLWLAAYLSLAQTVANNLVICFGTDGHVAVEVAFGNGQCGDEIHSGSEHLCPDITHCGPCQDIAITSEHARTWEQINQVVPAVCLQRNREHFEQPDAVVCTPSEIPSSVLAFPPPLRTVFLLI